MSGGDLVRDLVKQVSAVLVKEAVKKAMSKLLAVKYLGRIIAMPVINPVVAFFLEKLVEFLMDETMIGASKLWISIQMSYEVGNAEEAADKLRDMVENPQKYLEAEQQKISEYFDETTIDLIQLSIKRLR